MPTTVKELQCFLGFANFCCHFIHCLKSIITPLTNLLKSRPKSLSWTLGTTKAMQQLKRALDHHTTLHPDPEKPFVIEVDTSTTQG